MSSRRRHSRRDYWTRRQSRPATVGYTIQGPETPQGTSLIVISTTVILYDNRIVLYKMESDVMMYVVGSVNENEVLLYNVILALRDSLVGRTRLSHMLL